MSFPRYSSYALVGVFGAFGLPGCSDANDTMLGASSFQREFSLAGCTMTPTGRSPYFVLEPGFQLVLEGDGARLEVTVLDETRVVDGVTTRVVEEREWKDGQLYEVARNYFAMCEGTKDVFYFGEDVDFYENGKVVKHDGSWLAGKDGNKAGLIMAGAPKVGMKYFQEIAPGVAMDRAEIVSVSETCKTPAGTFPNCLKVKEYTSHDFWSSLMFWQAEYKMHAPGVGLVQDEDLVLTKTGVANTKSGAVNK
jgi:hypothetical protein